jgi:hypothetical protein
MVPVLAARAFTTTERTTWLAANTTRVPAVVTLVFPLKMVAGETGVL